MNALTANNTNAVAAPANAAEVANAVPSIKLGALNVPAAGSGLIGAKALKYKFASAWHRGHNFRYRLKSELLPETLRVLNCH